MPWHLLSKRFLALWFGILPLPLLALLLLYGQTSQRRQSSIQ